MQRVVTIFLSFILSTSLITCTLPLEITVDQNKSANIVTMYSSDEEVLKYKSSEIITDCSASEGNLNFTIQRIDSLGRYIPFFNEGFFKFRLENDILSISDGHSDDVFTGKPKSHLDVIMHFDQEVEILKSTNTKVKALDNRTIAFFRTKQHLENEEKRMELILKFK